MNSSEQPLLEIVAGPNGSGKTTFAQAYLVNRLKRDQYFNPDVIASGFSQVDFERASFMAGRVLLSEVKSQIDQRKSFVMESTLSGKTWEKILRKAKSNSYKIVIYFVFLEKISLNFERIRERVEAGGHNILREVVKRRMSRVFNNFWDIYRPICDNWMMFNNTEKTPVLWMDQSQFQALSVEKQAEFRTLFLKGKPHGFKK